MLNADCGGSIIIGNNVLIGPNVVVRSADHNFSSADTLIQKQGHTGGRITIEDDVWIGANAVILKGVTIKTGAVVGAGAVVTKDVDEYVIAGGVPAKKISSRD
ncbi:MAG: acyltransferase [Methanomicrobiaceae archaeon]|nr:acyltransferase [Methanomicrobiaceae archaeon]